MYVYRYWHTIRPHLYHLNGTWAYIKYTLYTHYYVCTCNEHKVLPSYITQRCLPMNIHIIYIYIFSHHVIAIPFELHMCVFWIHMSMYATSIKCSIHSCRYVIYIYIYIFIYVYLFTFINIYIYIYTLVCLHTQTHIYIYICAPFHLYTIWTACVLILDTHGYVCTCNDNKLLHSYIWMSVWMSKNTYI